MSKVGLIPRRAALDVLLAVASGAYAEVALDRVVKKFSLKAADKSLTTELAYGAIRNRLFLDCWIDNLGKVTHNKQPPLLRWLLHLGLYQILKMDRIPSSAAINTTVELSKEKKLVRLAPVVNAILRGADRAFNSEINIPIPNSLSARISQEQSIPIWLIVKLIDWFGDELAENIAKSFNKIPSFDLRVNSLHTSPIKLKNDFNFIGIKSNFIEDLPNSLEIQSGLGDLKEWPGYEKGEWSVQDRSSQLVVPLLNPCPGENVLDACAAPGSKTTHIAELMQNTGELWAVDRSAVRLKKVSENAKRLRINCIRTFTYESHKLLEIKPEWRSYFHRILIDAPCSGLGTLARNPDARWRMTEEKIKDLIQLQQKLLDATLPLIKEGGTIVYSTCTINPEENSQQIERLTSLNPQITLEDEFQILPGIDRKGDGFYVAIMKC